MIYKEPRFLNCGDKAILVEFGSTIDPKINQKVRHLMIAIQRANIAGIIETVPSYSTLLIYYNPLQIEPDHLREILHNLVQLKIEKAYYQPFTVEIPTVYGGEYGPDLEFIASTNNLRVNDVIQIHTSASYLTYMLGFIPGFPYLGGMSPWIAAPRLDTPRNKIPAGSIGIAETQTGIYPSDSPGGWRIIGRTPVKLFDPMNEPPALLHAGDYLTFVSITPEEFKEISEAVKQGTYVVKKILKE